MIPAWIEQTAKDEDFIREVMRIMRKNHLGMAKAAKKEELMRELFGVTKHTTKYDSTERVLRMAIEVANQDFCALIVSDTVHGYWWASSLEDGLDPAERNMSRARTILDNAKKLVDNLKSEYGGQMGFGL